MAASNMNPLYDRSKHFFDNVQLGPRELTATEVTRVRKLKDDIRALEARGLSLRKILFPGFEASMPFGLAAGPAYGSKFLNMYASLGYGFLTHKTVRAKEWQANPMPHNTYLASGSFEEGFTTSQAPTTIMANSFGMHSLSPEVWQADIKGFKQANQELPLVVSGVATQCKTVDDNVDEYVKIGVMAEETGTDAYEVNVSCPNEMEGHSGELQDDNDFIEAVLNELKQKLKIPVLLKIGHRKNMAKVAGIVGDVLGERGGIVAINSIHAVIKAPDGSYAFGDRRPRAGISFAPLMPYTKDALKQLVKAKEEFGYSYRIFSVGGVITPTDVVELLGMGADAVESGAGAMTIPTLGLEVKKYLLEQALKRA